MDLIEAIKTNGTCRYYKTDPVPEDLILKILRAAQMGPSGSNRQPVEFLVVRDVEKRQKLKSLYLPVWAQYMSKMESGEWQVRGREKLLKNADHYAQHMDEVPVQVVICFPLTDFRPIDSDLDRVSVVGGSSIYPVVQNLLLAARNEGLGTTLTTIHCVVEPDVKLVLEIPEDIGIAAIVSVGWPAKAFPKQLKRRPLAEISHADTYGQPLIDSDVEISL